MESAKKTPQEVDQKTQPKSEIIKSLSPGMSIEDKVEALMKYVFGPDYKS